MKRTWVIIFIFFWGASDAQDLGWWDAKHNWDGITPRTDLLTFSPAFMGPNALPVPPIQNGRLPESFYATIAFEGHFSKGDDTKGLHTSLYTPLFSERVGLFLNYVPVEFYQMDTITRDLRRAMDFDGKGVNTTDLYVSTFISLLQDHEHLPDILLTINLRTASGDKLTAARTTDAPGYFFDVSIGKTYLINQSFIQSIRPYTMTGFYVWQTNGESLRQNDAIQFGAGIDLETSNILFKNAIGGYAGYIGNGDTPIVYRTTIQTQFDSPINYQLQFQQGLHNYDYTSFRIGIRYSPSTQE